MIFETKRGINLEDLKMIHPNLLIIFTQVVLYTQEFDLPLEITSLRGDRKNIKTTSRTHSEGRAFDMSVRGWTSVDVSKFVNYLNLNYTEYGAISKSDLKSRLAIFHNSGYGDHIHVQVRNNQIYRFVRR